MTEAKISGEVRWWTKEIELAKKRDKNFRKEGDRVRAIYSGDKTDTTPFNILYSNTETMLPALYARTPKPIVRRRFKDDDQLGRAAAMVGERSLDFLIDTNIEGYETFDDAMRDTVFDALVPGRGVARVKYEAETVEIEESGAAEIERDPDEPEEESEPLMSKAWESVCMESVGWNRVVFGYARKWAKVPWIAFEHYFTRGEAKEMFGAAVASKMKYTTAKQRDDDESARSDVDEGDDTKTCLVYEIWRKKGNRVLFFSPSYPHGYLKEEDDPLELTGFFPVPKPLQLLRLTDELNARSLYLVYENQAKELNRISVRINRIVEALKVRGAYDGSLGGSLATLLDAEDNTLTATENASGLAMEGGLDKYIWFMPVDKLVLVLQQLIVAREQCKQVIYEVSGLSDILRGSTDANETATAQNIKNQWGSLRLKMHQREVQRFVRDALRLMLEVAAKKFSPDTFARITGLPYVTAQDKAMAQQIVQMAQMQGMQPDPQAMKAAQTPSWEEIKQILADDLSRSYRVDIETDSTIEIDEAMDRENMSQALAALSQFVSGIGPMVQEGIMPFEAAKSMLMVMSRKFRFGTEIEEQLKAMQAPQPKQDPEALQKQMEEEKQRLMLEVKAADDKAKAEDAVRKASLETDYVKKSADLDVRELKLQAEEQRLNLERQLGDERRNLESERLRIVADSAKKDIANKEALHHLKTQKMSVEKVVDNKANEVIGTSMQNMQELVKELAMLVTQNHSQQQEMMQTLMAALTAPKIRKPVRDPKTRELLHVEESVA